MKCVICGGHVMDCGCQDREIVPTPVRKPIYRIQRHRLALQRSAGTNKAKALLRRMG